MQSEEFDKKIKEAAENHHPPFDEKAWMNMEKLLNTHLPVEKEKKRRFIFLLFFFILLAGGGYFLFEAGRARGRDELALKQEKAEINREKAIPTIKNRQEIKRLNSSGEKTGIISTQGTEDKPSEPAVRNRSLATIDLRKAGRRESRSLIEGSFAGNEKNNQVEDHMIKQVEERTTKTGDISGIDKKNEENKLPEKDIIVAKKDDAITKALSPGKTGNTAGVDSSFIKKNGQGEKLVTAENKKVKKGAGSFIISASVAPDVSIVGNEVGGLKLAAGFGMGYQKGRITLRSGIYSARKIYNAYPEDYNAPAIFYSYYPNLQEVKADCKVYEIPLLLSYSFGAKRNWFASTGLSSYLMKRETYNYFYKYTTTSPVVSRERTIRNENNHYFAVLNLSAGYQRSITNRISVSAEPYAKVPLEGIGYGKVKLNSAGVLVSVTFKPFLPKIKK